MTAWTRFICILELEWLRYLRLFHGAWTDARNRLVIRWHFHDER